MDNPKIDIEEVMKLQKEGFKIILGARYTHHAESDNRPRKSQVIEKDRKGTLVKICDLDAPEHISSWGTGIDINWGDIVASYNDFFAVNGSYVKNEFLSGVDELFYVKKKISPESPKQLKFAFDKS